ncbi:MAG: hypothetical protein LAT53_04395 [Idiomarina sp.]|nr:hypothetical protein [Idiomarina sp.]
MWTKQQRDCMEALGMPIYEFTGTQVKVDDATPAFQEAEVNVTDTPLTDPDLSVPDTVLTDPILYRLGPWYLQFSELLPAAGFSWLQDLALFIGGNPVQVSHAPEAITPIACDAFAQNQLTPEQKRELWNQLKPALSS